MLLVTRNGSKIASLRISVDQLAVKADNRISTTNNITEEVTVEATHDGAVEDDGRDTGKWKTKKKSFYH